MTLDVLHYAFDWINGASRVFLLHEAHGPSTETAAPMLCKWGLGNLPSIPS